MTKRVKKLKLHFMFCRRYTKFYGTDVDAAASLAHDAILGIVQFLA
jgi:hypothetical protein